MSCSASFLQHSTRMNGGNCGMIEKRRFHRRLWWARQLRRTVRQLSQLARNTLCRTSKSRATRFLVAQLAKLSYSFERVPSEATSSVFHDGGNSVFPYFFQQGNLPLYGDRLLLVVHLDVYICEVPPWYAGLREAWWELLSAKWQIFSEFTNFLGDFCHKNVYFIKLLHVIRITMRFPIFIFPQPETCTHHK